MSRSRICSRATGSQRQAARTNCTIGQHGHGAAGATPMRWARQIPLAGGNTIVLAVKIQSATTTCRATTAATRASRLRLMKNG